MSDESPDPGPNELQCPDCETIMPRSKDFCPECGVSLYREKTARDDRGIDFSAATDAGRLRWVVAGLVVLALALLFAGGVYVYLYGVPPCQLCPSVPIPVDSITNI